MPHGIEETVWHTLVECPVYENERQELRPLLPNNPSMDRPATVTQENLMTFTTTGRNIGKTGELSTRPGLNKFADPKIWQRESCV